MDKKQSSTSGDPKILHREKILKIIEPEGLLSQTIKGFEPRLQQQKMMGDIIDAYNESRIELIEAGTGTGKSLAYLIPALIWAAVTKERTVISTNTINLQEQLVSKDIPTLLTSLNLDLGAVLVKGMSHYLCLRKLEDAKMEMPLFSPYQAEEIHKIETWSQTTTDGSRAELPFIPSTWDQLNAESEACSRQECPFFSKCFFFKARKRAGDAHILVVNHHLLFSDLMARADDDNYSDTSILPSYKRIILDEAHHIEDIATEHFADHLNRLDVIRYLAKLTSDKQSTAQGKLIILKQKILTLFPKDPPREIAQIISRLSIELPAMRHVLHERIHTAFDSFAKFIENIQQSANTQEDQSPAAEKKLRLLQEHSTHPYWQEDTLPHANKLIDSLIEYLQMLYGLEIDLKQIDHDRLQEQTKGTRIDIAAATSRLELATNLLKNFMTKESKTNKVRWIESRMFKALHNVHLYDVDLDVSEALVKYLFSKFSTIILCSATLTTNKRFQFIRERFGLKSELLPNRTIVEHVYDSPFDYKKQTLLAIPTDIPPPNDPSFQAIAFENIWLAIEASKGQAFVLFTSYSMLQKCYETLAARCNAHRYPIFRQGDESRRKVLEKFKQTRGAVLFGTDSFWEGVDVVGDALRSVIIVKLPFKVPNEPIIQARTEAILNRGGNPFYEFSIPHAIVKFKQGFGRLIRHKKDRGCIICLDTRLVMKEYGKLFLNSLPPCQTAFMRGELLWPKITEFYKQTYHLTK